MFKKSRTPLIDLRAWHWTVRALIYLPIAVGLVLAGGWLSLGLMRQTLPDFGTAGGSIAPVEVALIAIALLGVPIGLKRLYHRLVIFRMDPYWPERQGFMLGTVMGWFAWVAVIERSVWADSAPELAETVAALSPPMVTSTVGGASGLALATVAVYHGYYHLNFCYYEARRVARNTSEWVSSIVRPNGSEEEQVNEESSSSRDQRSWDHLDDPRGSQPTRDQRSAGQDLEGQQRDTSATGDSGQPNGGEPAEQPSEEVASQGGDNASAHNHDAEEASEEQDRADQIGGYDWASDTEFYYDWVDRKDLSFEDVGGMEELKHLCEQNFIGPVLDDGAAQALGISTPNLLLHGPPGTGKSFFAEAVAGELADRKEANVPFVKLSGGEIGSKWINQSSQQIDRLFEEAEYKAGKEGVAIVFIDEIDSVLQSREDIFQDENRKVVNEFLVQLQDLSNHESKTGKNVVVIGATNTLDQMDEAATRNGRFDCKLRVDTPDLDGCRKILDAHLSDRENQVSDPDRDGFVERMGRRTPAKIEAIVEEAARHALFVRGNDYIQREDLYTALQQFDDEHQ